MGMKVRDRMVYVFRDMTCIAPTTDRVQVNQSQSKSECGSIENSR